jgi:aminoglycoside phosphotransferase (APT) family kinase protein
MADRAAQITAWYQAQLEDPSIRAVVDGSADTGYSNEVLFATVHFGEGSERAVHDHADVHEHFGDDHEHVVVRLAPSGPPLFPTYELEMQAEVQRFAEMAGVPVPDPIVVEQDPAWLGAPFMVMPLVEGRLPGEVPVSSEWILALSEDEQARIETALLEKLARLHRAPLADGALPSLRRPASLADDVRWWADYAAWACDGVAGVLGELFSWCAERVPASEPPPSVLWGDVRLGNVIVGDDLTPVAVLDWEMASIGPAEGDLAWYTSQQTMMARFFGSKVPGFGDRDQLVATYEGLLGRELQDFRWHECFAMARSAAVHHRAEIVGALIEGRDLPTTEDSFLITYTAKQLAKEP